MRAQHTMLNANCGSGDDTHAEEEKGMRCTQAKVARCLCGRRTQNAKYGRCRGKGHLGCLRAVIIYGTYEGHRGSSVSVTALSPWGLLARPTRRPALGAVRDRSIPGLTHLTVRVCTASRRRHAPSPSPSPTSRHGMGKNVSGRQQGVVKQACPASSPSKVSYQSCSKTLSAVP